MATALALACDLSWGEVALRAAVSAARPKQPAESGAIVAVEQPEAVLMARYCQGDAAAFEALYQKVGLRLHRYLMGLCGTRDGADDLLQQTLLKLHEARDLYIRGADPVPWLFTIAHRTFLDEARRKKRARVQLTPDGELPAETIDSALPADAPELDERSPLSAAMMAALAQLPEQQREALVLTKVDGRSHAEAATITGTSAGAIKLRAHRAYVTLRTLLNRSASTPEKSA